MRMWLTELVRILMGVFIMFLFSFSLFVYYSLSSLGGGEIEEKERYQGIEIDPVEYRRYLEEYVL